MKSNSTDSSSDELPQGWEIRTLGELGKFKNGINKGKEDFGHGSPFVNLMDVFGVPRLSEVTGLGLVNSSVDERTQYELRSGDVLFVRSSVKPEGVGLTTLVALDLRDTVFSGFLIRFREDGDLVHEFKQYCFSDMRFRTRLLANSTISANTNINQEALKALTLAFPKRHEEQLAIAAALIDVDALLGALDRLIAKKRDLKQAAMQQLLTGQTRLPGFSEKWTISTVGREFEIQLGKMLDTERNIGVPKPYLGNKAVQWDRIDLNDLKLMSMSDADLERYRLRSGDLLVCEGGEIGRAAIWNAPSGECYYQKALHRLRPIRGFNTRFMMALLRYWTDHELLRDFVSQTSIAHLTREKFAEVPLPAPTLPEQAAIAAVLSDMDSEITALEALHDKTRLLKQGMMQELLTGRIRLV